MRRRFSFMARFGPEFNSPHLHKIWQKAPFRELFASQYAIVPLMSPAPVKSAGGGSASGGKPKNKKPAQKQRGWRGALGGPSFFGNLVTTVLIFLLLMSAYSLIESFVRPSDTIPLSVVAADVAEGKVKAITVNGDSLD